MNSKPAAAPAGGAAVAADVAAANPSAVSSISKVNFMVRTDYIASMTKEAKRGANATVRKAKKDPAKQHWNISEDQNQGPAKGSVRIQLRFPLDEARHVLFIRFVDVPLANKSKEDRLPAVKQAVITEVQQEWDDFCDSRGHPRFQLTHENISVLCLKGTAQEFMEAGDDDFADEQLGPYPKESVIFEAQEIFRGKIPFAVFRTISLSLISFS